MNEVHMTSRTSEMTPLGLAKTGLPDTKPIPSSSSMLFSRIGIESAPIRASAFT